ncbi:DUF4365 domain-containing protein [Chitinimonas arctica]|uniref:DUF4365 domain-containing protein n=1 Tax=Chitinimonas arctica TaxID=2594795 RepID=A0A516SAY1_9NEIS|nr:DUF4365 domain-containing protein [Chitinimonas arctica]QDQ25303.1 DUF4365 domain-containing protein [Chitinimonas arctica]
MTKKKKTNFPTADHNHEISKAAKFLLSAKCPKAWELKERDGEGDFGLDFEIQVAKDGQIYQTFRVQLKGTESPCFVERKTKISINIERTTLNYYAQIVEPVMLVVAIVCFDENGKADLSKSEVYWQWIQEELKRTRGASLAIDKSKHKTKAIHVPLINKITPFLDISPYLQRKIDHVRSADDLDALIRSASGENFSPADNTLAHFVNFLKNDPEKARLIFSFDYGSELTPGGAAPKDKLAEAHFNIKVGKTALAEEFLTKMKIGDYKNSPILHASVASLEGKVALQRLRKEDALRFFEKAYQISPEEKYLLALEELRLLDAIDKDDNEIILSIEKNLANVNSNEGLGLLVRVQCFLENFEDAAKTMLRIDKSLRNFPEVVILSCQRKWKDVQSRVDKALLEPSVSGRDAVGLNLLAATACWQIGLESTTIPLATKGMEIPLQGVPDLNVEFAKKSLSYSIACLKGLKELGWLLNVEIIVPVAVLSAASVGQQAQIIPLLEEAAIERPTYPVLQENLELLYISAGDFKSALKVNTRQRQNDEVLVRRVCLQFQLMNYVECVISAMEVVSKALPTYKQTPLALALAYGAALKVARISDADRILKYLRENKDWCEFIYFSEFVKKSLESDEQDAGLVPLRNGLVEFPQSQLLASNLFYNLRVYNLQHAFEAVSIAQSLRKNFALNQWDCQHLIEAYIRLERWEDAEQEGRRAIAKFGETGTLLSMLAVVLEMQGKTGEAVDLLKKAIYLGQQGITTLRNYLGICLRLGHMDASQGTIEKLLAIVKDRAERVDFLRMKVLILAHQGLYERAFTVVQEIGRLVKQDNEAEEGLYINLHMNIALSVDGLPSEEARDISERIQNFCEKWPNSNILRVMRVTGGEVCTVDTPSTGEGMVRTNYFQQRLKQYKEREAHAKSGDFLIPFITRPNYVFSYIHDCFTLWAAAKRSKPEEKQYHLISASLESKKVSERDLCEIPLLDLTALLVLVDLGLFHLLFLMFPRIAIPKCIINYISRNACSPFLNKEINIAANAILVEINANLLRIDQPGGSKKSAESITGDIFSDYLDLAASGRWIVYTDDGVARDWINSECPGLISLNTVEFLLLADCQDRLTPMEVASHLGKLISWNVEITVAPRYLIASLSGAVEEKRAENAAKRLDKFHNHLPFTILARAIWNMGKSPLNLTIQMGTVLAEILNDEKSEEESIAAVWAFWFLRVKFHKDIQTRARYYLTASLLLAILNIPVHLVSRAIRIFFMVIEIDVGAENMTHQEQRDALKMVGAEIGKLATTQSFDGEICRYKIASAFTQGTEYGEIFSDAYLAAFKESCERMEHAGSRHELERR